MTHKQLLDTVAKKMDLTLQEAAILSRELTLAMADQLDEHGKIRIKNFGAFVTVTHKSRTVPDPRERSKKLVIFDQRLIKFRPSEQLKAMVKNVQPNHQALIEEGEVSNQLIETAEPEIEGDVTDQQQTKSAIEPTVPDYIDLSTLTIDQEVLQLIPANIAEKYQLAPIEKNDQTIVVAMTDPGDREAIDIVERQTGLTVTPKITTADELQHVLDQYGTDAKDLEQLKGQVENPEKTGLSELENALDDSDAIDAPATKAVTSLLERAVRSKASDIHLEPTDKELVVRYRLDGILQQAATLPKQIHAAITSRLKIMSNLKIDETRLPQDGRLRITVDHRPIDFRLSTLPTVNGEKIVMRILDNTAGMMDFEDLGLQGETLRRVKDNINKSHGMFLVTGPTGSGKTTTLYSVIGKIITPEINIITVEDPVEYRIQGVNQSQVNSDIGYDFSSGLRSIVRQDPDVILIGEIRDLETATMAIHSALTGHVVLSTLHTNDAAGAVPRLIDMGIEPFLITSSTNLVLAQRLVRKICPECREKVSFPTEALTEIKKEIEAMPDKERKQYRKTRLTFYKGKGCKHCNNSGYKGRFGIFEALTVSESIKQLALQRVPSSLIAQQAIKEGMMTMKQDGIIKALAGQTTLEEVWRVTKD